MPSAEDPSAVPIGTSPRYRTNKQHGMSISPVDVGGPKPGGPDIIDIRRAAVETSLKAEVLSMFHAKDGPRKLPTLLLYDERGLQLFERITYLDEYYLTSDEIDVLRSSAADIAKSIPAGAMIIELGSGNLRKVNLLLQALEDAAKNVDYYALDLSRKELERTLAQLPAYDHVRSHGLLGTYDDGQEWLKHPSIASRQKCILSLGSSIGNFDREEASDFLKGFADVLGHGDTMLIGVDTCNDPAKVYHAYNDKEGVTHEFVLNGLHHANEVLGETTFNEQDWAVIGEYVYDGKGGRHQAFYSPVRDTIVMGELVRPHERIQVEQSLKYSPEETQQLWGRAGMTEIGQWRHGDEYGLHMLAKPKMSFSMVPSVYARNAIPAMSEWEALWAAWDVVTHEMLPREELLEKPIKLRNACIFYLGHIPTFLDIQLTKTTKKPPSDPAYFYNIFERGIDPDVDNPELCHSHSEIPDEWPPVNEIVAYQNRVRSRLQDIYAGGHDKIPRHVGRAIWVGFEHELMHIETLLYMMLQSNKTRPPPHIQPPDFEKLAAQARSERVANEWFDIPAQDISIGLFDPAETADPNAHFGWDNEKPVRNVKVHAFRAQGRPISNEEYARYMYSMQIDKIPAAWAETNEPLLKGSDRGIVTSSGVNGHANGHSNGVFNGSSNDHTNGSLNGHQNGSSRSYGYSESASSLPESFLEGKAVRTVFGLVPLKHALDWPIFASYDELTGCAAWMGGRIPTFEETRSIYAHVDALKKKDPERQLGKTVPAVNGHLSNNGVEISPPPSPCSSKADGQEQQLYIDLGDANVGFQHWHPVPITGHGGTLAGQAEMGGVWEWTSSVLRPWDRFTPMPLYPGYTADFFDDKHNIVLGGSWATHPRIAGRKTFLNWYQRNYPYAWVGARLVRDLN
ncbi:C-type lectin protein [Apodospora peruviana]|uniref:C-type lectin protein n=1 Tax=Apodospora peruviana TaxID=516989 RepID=A0AAE0M3R6_9PEZI|nr:C-type lectin protein [Apodospora peruviana]